jgi:hypothetical protein
MRRQNVATGSTLFFSLIMLIAQPNRPALIGDAQRTGEKICEIKSENYRRKKFGPYRLLVPGHRCVNIFLQEFPSFILLCISLSLNFSPFSQLSLSPPLYISLPISISLAISFFLAISFSHYIAEYKQIQKKES